MIAKKVLLFLVLSLGVTSAFATKYRSGMFGCGDFEDTEREYLDHLINPTPYHEILTLVYGNCLQIKGEVTGDQSLVSQGNSLLYDLAHDPQESNLVANYLLAEYYFTGGDFKSLSPENLDLAASYYDRAMGIINNYGSAYPTPKYIKWEETDNIEMTIYNALPRVYFEMFLYGVSGDYSLKVINSPSYKGGHDENTYPKYRDKIMSSINLAIEHARTCKNLPMKPHFDRDSHYYIEICAMYYEKFQLLKAIEEERQVLSSQSGCQDLGSEEVIETNCPEMKELGDEFIDIVNSVESEIHEILSPIQDQLASNY